MTPFSPIPGQTVNINVAATSANVQVSDRPGSQQVRVMNDGTATVWIRFGSDNSVAATATASVPVAAGATEVLTAPMGPVWAAAIAAGATGKVCFTPGGGI